MLRILNYKTKEESCMKMKMANRVRKGCDGNVNCSNLVLIGQMDVRCQTSREPKNEIKKIEKNQNVLHMKIMLYVSLHLFGSPCNFQENQICLRQVPPRRIFRKNRRYFSGSLGDPHYTYI